jgi:hypothetical protein
VKKILEEQSRGKEQPQENGTFALQYTSPDLNGKTLTIPLESPNTKRQDWSNYSIENHVEQNTNPYSSIRF